MLFLIQSIFSMYRVIFISGFICFLHQITIAQIGYSSPGNAVIATDSFSTRQIGKAATLKCVRLGPCTNNCAVYTFVGSGNWNIEGNWEGMVIPPIVLTGCSQIVINPLGNNECLLNIPLQTIPAGTSIAVMPGKKFRIPGKLIQQ